jgi:antitoxin FitA
MAQMVVRNIEESVKARLQRRAKRNGHSMEEEVREILRNAANQEDRPVGGLGSEIAALISGSGLRFELPKLPGNTMEPPSFGDE